MRIRRSLTTLVTPAGNSSADATLPSSNPADCQTTTPSRCSTAASSSSSSLVCVLNQSPWDVADPSSQLEGGLFSLTGTSIVHDLAVAVASQSFKLSVTKRTQRDVAAASDKNSYRRENIVRLSPPQGKIMAEKNNSSAVLSSKPQTRSSDVKQPPSTDPTPPTETTRRRGRPAKNSASNPNEFYYYSGFGPHWGKKRDSITKRPTTPAPKAVLAAELNNEMPSQQAEGRGRDVEFVDYEEDEDDDNDENDKGISRGGGRKRVKARSLKSLM